MIHWRGIPAWLLKAWPVLSLLPTGLIHWYALTHFPESTTMVNEIVGTTLQIVGGILVLFSINDNLGLFRKQSLLLTIAGWFKSFPRASKSVTIALSGVGAATAAGSATLTTGRVPRSLEERLAQLEHTVKELRQEVATNASLAQQRLQETRQELTRLIETTNVQLTELTQKVQHAAVGGFKLQALGVLLAVYGALTSLFA